jgi:hypothetical protein
LTPPAAAVIKSPAQRRGVAVTESQEQRIAREEQTWNAPKLFGFGFVFLGVCIAIIYVLASI